MHDRVFDEGFKRNWPGPIKTDNDPLRIIQCGSGYRTTGEREFVRADLEQGRREGWAAFRDTFKKRVWDMKNPCTIADVVTAINTHHKTHYWNLEAKENKDE